MNKPDREQTYYSRSGYIDIYIYTQLKAERIAGDKGKLRLEAALQNELLEELQASDDLDAVASAVLIPLA